MADLSKIKLPNGNTYDVKDTESRTRINEYISVLGHPQNITLIRQTVHVSNGAATIQNSNIHSDSLIFVTAIRHREPGIFYCAPEPNTGEVSLYFRSPENGSSPNDVDMDICLLVFNK